MTDQLATRIADGIDAAASPVTAAEAMQHSTPYAIAAVPPRHRHAHRWVGAAAAAVLCAAGVATWSAMERGDEVSTADPAGRSITSLPFDVTSCLGGQSSTGCPMDATEAARVLGIALPSPTAVPDGWEQVESRSALRYWPANGDQPAVADFNEVWAPIGTDLDAAGATPTYVQLRRRVALPGEPTSLGTAQTLPDGRTVHRTGNTVSWTTDGVTSRLSGYGVTDDDLLAIAASLP